MTYDITQADILAWAEAYDGPLFHALICDPPYHLTSGNMGVDWSAFPHTSGRGGPKGPTLNNARKGFMGKTWDGGDIAFRPETWATIGKLLHPGAFGMAFASTRGFHRMAVAIEDAGFIIHPMICWSFGSGFPKATRIKYETCQCGASEETKHDMSGLRKSDIQKAVFNGAADDDNLQPSLLEYSAPENTARESSWQDQSRRQEWLMEGRRDVSTATRQLRVSKICAMPGAALINGARRWLCNGASFSDGPALRSITGAGRGRAPRRSQSAEQYAEQPGAMAGQPQPQDVGARQHCDRCGLPTVDIWSGYRYGLQSLKPAVEPVIVFQKPYAARPVDSITRTGAGALNIDGGRIGTDEIKVNGYKTGEQERGAVLAGRSPDYEGGIHTGRWPANLILSHTPDCADDCAPGCPVAALGAQSGESESSDRPRYNKARDEVFYGQTDRFDRITGGHDDTGTAARFFFNADYALERLEQADPLIYVPKASTAEREAGLSGFDPAADGHTTYGEFKGIPGTKHTPNGRGAFPLTTVDDGREKPIDNPYLRGETTRRNTHPTIKPIALARHLATLLLPPDLYAPRRLLIPFAGAGSEMIGAMLAGWDEVVGVELEAEHVEIARARIAFWQQLRYKLMNPDAPVKVQVSKAPIGQVDMFAEEAA